MKYLKVDTSRDGYQIDQIRTTLTVGELMYVLEQYDEDLPVYLSFDGGYTYGGLHEYDFDIDD